MGAKPDQEERGMIPPGHIDVYSLRLEERLNESPRERPMVEVNRPAAERPDKRGRSPTLLVLTILVAIAGSIA